MARLKVYKKGTKEILTELSTYQYSGECMGERKVTASCSSPVVIDFGIGDYVELRGEVFKIVSKPSAKKQARRGEVGNGYVYDNIVFQSAIYDLSVVNFKDYVLKDNNVHYSGLGDFSFYMTKLEDLGDRIIANIERVYGEGVWQILYGTSDIYDDNGNMIVKGADVEIKAKNIAISAGTSLQSALNLYNSDYDLNYIVTMLGGKCTIIVGGTAIVSGANLGYGKGRGFLSLQQNRGDNDAIITRLHPYGSTRNLPYRYYNNFYNDKDKYPEMFDEDGNYILESMYINKLMLPYAEWVKQGKVFDSYIDSENIDIYGLREGEVTFDGSDENWDEIYPSIEGMTIDDIQPGMTGYGEDYKTEVTTYSQQCINFLIGAGVHEYDSVLFTRYIVEKPETWDETYNLLTRQLDRFLTGAGGTESFKLGKDTVLTYKIERELANETIERIESLAREFFNKYPNGTWNITYGKIETGTFEITQELIDKVRPTLYDKKSLDMLTGGSDKQDDPERIVDNGISEDGTYEDGTLDTNGTPIPTFFNLYIPQCFFNPKTFYDGTDTFHICMKSGMCAGREFEVISVESNGGYEFGWKLTCKRDDSNVSDMNMVFPNKLFKISAGDKFVLTGISMPPIYVQAAEYRLLRQSTEYLSDYDHEQYSYTPVADNIFLAENPDLADSILEGKCLTINDRDANDADGTVGDLGIGDKMIVIKSLTIKYNESNIPRYDIQLDESINSVTIQQVVNTQIKRSQSAFETANKIQLLSKIDKYDDDEAEGFVRFKSGIGAGTGDTGFDEFGKLRASTADIVGKVQAQSLTLGTEDEDIDAQADDEEAISERERFMLSVNGNAKFNDVTRHKNGISVVGASKLNGEITIGERYNKGVEGGFCDKYANMELNSLVLRDSLTVPKLIFEKTEVTAGNTWHCSGGGKIKRVWENVNVLGQNADGYGIIELDLVEGEIGAVVNNDICQGVWHMSSGNDTANSDSKNGQFSFAGFKTIYFLVHQVIDKTRLDTYKTNWERNLKPRMGEEAYNELITDIENSLGLNRFFFYRTRASRGQIETSKDIAFTDNTPPQPQMDFAAYGNTSRADRQSAFLETTKYALLLAGVSSWNYNSDNFQYIRGDMSGFNIRTIKDGNQSLNGYGVGFGKAYMWGNIVQFDRDPSIVSQQIYYLTTDKASGVTASTEGWKTDYTPTSPQKPYLWQYYLVTYDNGNTETTTPFLAANYASDGTGIEINGTAYEVLDHEDWDMRPIEWFDVTKLYLVKANYDIAFKWYYDELENEWKSEDASNGETYVVSGNLWAASRGDNGLLDWIDCGNIKGDTGKNGDNAVMYEVECSLSQWKKEEGDTYAMIYLVKIDGANRKRMTYNEVRREGITTSITGHSAWIDWNDIDQQIFYGDEQTGTVTINFSKGGMVIASHTFTVIQDGQDGEDGSPGNRGSSFRVLRWEEVKNGDRLYARQQIVGEDLTLCDVVIYTDSDGNKTKWLCIKDYIKNNGDIPSSLTGFFKAFNSFQNIATDVLLADIANIDQLQVNKVLIYDKSGKLRVNLSPDRLFFNAPVINDVMEYDYVNKTCHTIDVAECASIATQPNMNALLFMPDKGNCPHSGLHVYINARLSEEVSGWGTFGNERYYEIWNKCATNPDTVTGLKRDDINALMGKGTLVCADRNIFYGNTKHTINGADPYTMAGTGDYSYYEGRFSVNGTISRFVFLMPGQTLSCRSSIETYIDPDGDERQYLIWYVENASDFIPCEVKVRDRQHSDGFLFRSYNKFLDQRLDPFFSADSYQDMFFGSKVIDANLYRNCYGTKSEMTSNVPDIMSQFVLTRNGDNSKWSIG